MASELDIYEYAPLPTCKSIRLLEIHDRDEDGLLQCSLETVDLDDLPVYNCLSYTWGAPGPASTRSEVEAVDYSLSNKWPVSCDKKLLFATPNLYDALQKLHQNKLELVEQPDSKGQTRLHLAASSGDLNMVAHLLYNGADITAQNHDANTPLDLAIEKEQHQVVKMMIQAETNRDNIDKPISVPQSHSNLRNHLILKAMNKYLAGLGPTEKINQSSERPGIERNFVWIDALCINQDDDDERSTQVNLMGSIYKSAQSVVVWLGRETEDTETASKIISKLANDKLEEKWKHYFGSDDESGQRDMLDTINEQSFSMLGVSENTDAEWDSLAAFLQLKWFHRSWIIQEIVLAQKILIFCGKYQIQWEELWRASRFLIYSSWSLRLAERTNAEFPLAQGPEAWTLARGAIKHGGAALALNCLGVQTIHVRPTQTTDPRDKIYSLLGFTAPPMFTKDPAATLVADYKKSVQRVYTEAARAILLDSENLLGLCLIEEKSERTTPGLPSWVPDYNTRGGRPAPLSSIGRLAENGALTFYRASGSFPRHLSFPLGENPILQTSGHEFDSISRTTSSNNDLHIIGGHFVDWLDLILSLPEIYLTNQRRSEVFWRTLIADVGNHESPAPIRIEGYFKKFLFLQLSRYFMPDGPRSIPKQIAFQEHAKKMDRLGFWPSDEEQKRYGVESQLAEKEHQPFDEFQNNFRIIYSWRRLFLTSKGFLGVGAQELRTGDSIWILPGSGVPFVLRKLESGNHQLIGDAYVHGIMQGEVVDSEDWRLQDLKLE